MVALNKLKMVALNGSQFFIPGRGRQCDWNGPGLGLGIGLGLYNHILNIGGAYRVVKFHP